MKVPDFPILLYNVLLNEADNWYLFWCKHFRGRLKQIVAEWLRRWSSDSRY